MVEDESHGGEAVILLVVPTQPFQYGNGLNQEEDENHDPPLKSC